MKNFAENWKKYLYGFWLGGSLGLFYGATLLDLRFWLVLLPTALFVTLFNEDRFNWD